jgi:mannonate dehydratase
MKRRVVLGGLGLGLLGTAAVLGWRRLVHPPRRGGPLPAGARALVEESLQGLDPARLIDAHVHVVGLGTGGSGCWVHPAMRSPLHPLRHARFLFYMGAAGITREDDADQVYVERLRGWVAGAGGRAVLLAFDQVYREDGQADRQASEFHTPDAWVLQLVARHPDLFLPGISVHPYRPDALDALEAGAAAGAVLMKWLPNAQRMDPASPRCDPFYRRLAELRLPLLVHAGEEQAVESGQAQRLGNPLRLRRALDQGVTVWVAHCATLGDAEDLDAPGHPPRPAFHLFLRLMREERYRDRLFGEISAVTQRNRTRWLPELLAAGDIHDRLVNGSDHPLPAIDPLISLGRLERLGLLDPRDRSGLGEIFEHNPLLFDRVLKRRLRHRGRAFPDAAFMPALSRGAPR